MPSAPRQIRALVFDVFGTVVDWRGSIVRECRALGRRRRIAADWEAFADAWRAGYRPAMARVRSGELPWMNIDRLHRMILDGLLAQFGLEGLTEDELDDLNRVWHRLDPWPDARRGLALLKRRHVIATLSNGNVALLVPRPISAPRPSSASSPRRSCWSPRTRTTCAPRRPAASPPRSCAGRARRGRK